MKIKQITNFQCPICNKIFNLENEAEECYVRCENILKLQQEVLELNETILTIRKKKKSLVRKLKNLNSEDNYSVYKSLSVDIKNYNCVSLDAIVKIAEKNCDNDIDRLMIKRFKECDDYE